MPEIKTPPANKEYRKNYDKVFRKSPPKQIDRPTTLSPVREAPLDEGEPEASE